MSGAVYIPFWKGVFLDRINKNEIRNQEIWVCIHSLWFIFQIWTYSILIYKNKKVFKNFKSYLDNSVYEMLLDSPI